MKALFAIPEANKENSVLQTPTKSENEPLAASFELTKEGSTTKKEIQRTGLTKLIAEAT